MSCPVVSCTGLSGTRAERRSLPRILSRNCGKLGFFLLGMACPVLLFVIYTSVMASSSPSHGSAVNATNIQPPARPQMKFQTAASANRTRGFAPAAAVRAYPVVRLPVVERPAAEASRLPVLRSVGEAVLRYACPYSNSIVISCGGGGGGAAEAEMALNLYRTSYERFKVRNHLFVGVDDAFCEALRSAGANCIRYGAEADAAPAGRAPGARYARWRAEVKLAVLRAAFRLNVSALMVDLDVVFFRNALLYLRCDRCDLMRQADSFRDDLHNGVYMVMPTAPSGELVERCLAAIRAGNRSAGGGVVNATLAAMKRTGSIRETILDEYAYPNGNAFFREGGRTFRGDYPCHNCILVHNNGLLTNEAKRYCFKEYGLWAVDAGRYYSDVDRKYLVYDNPWTFKTPRDTAIQERRALRTAFIIGRVLNRVVILPKFHGARRPTSLLNVVSVPRLDAQLAGSYREHAFLGHALVPPRTRHHVTGPFILLPRAKAASASYAPRNVTARYFRLAAVSVPELVTWFHLTPASVLRFHSLYIDVLPNESIYDFLKVVDKALK